MDVSNERKKIMLVRKTRSRDGTVTTVVKPKLHKKKKVVVARGKGEHTVGNVIASQLYPFRNHMQQALQRKGFNTHGVPFKEVIPLYYNEFCSNKENAANSLVPINTYEFRNNPAWRIHPSDNLNGDINDFRNHDYLMQVSGAVDNIVAALRNAKMKKREAILNGVNPKEVLSDEELAQANAADKVERQLENKIMDSQPVKWGNIRNLLFVVLGFCLFYYMFV